MAREIASLLLRNSLGSLHSDPPQCSRCRRSPLVGELLYLLRSGKRVCSLCAARSASIEGEPVGSERVHSSERRLAVVQQRAA
ncbi:MAG: hypothetical protein QOG41_2496 [Thermoleophilaceae bacterium]|jgi:hypothetical protein|nr:hypothetical protein [Thermoleophilaceae bacterium]MEA2349447.1 hypothetical protein [Thermoleophilaceae bacterium]MEA2352513.1 hypothetical protein [Thermoleophilaceae bacterium]MEA2367634.1 hypothetical protein [Thermoleophilaceae bacterium]MEA2389723.1 hypothetical protein [Thermoleophilaceae bacterium]